MIEVRYWGIIDYLEAWDRQKELVKESQLNKKNFFVLCEHPSVITIGKSGSESNIVFPEEQLKMMGINVIYTDRGGDVTLHNPGQLIGYPIFNLENFKMDLHWFLRQIEGAIIELLSLYNIQSGRVSGLTGVWIKKEKKICAIGLHSSRWVTSHGFALNVSNDLKEFDYIIPCGISNKGITSIKEEIGTDIELKTVRNDCVKVFEKIFNKK